MSPDPAGLRVGVLASGAGTNLQALIDHAHGRDGVAIVAVGSDRPDALALQRAEQAGIEAAVFTVARYADRAARDLAMAGWLAGHGAELVVLAGYMQLVAPAFLQRFPDRVVNVHPSLLPAFPGIGAVEQALAYGVRVIGVTVHLVDEGTDTGAIIAQEAIALPDGADAQATLRSLRPLEHRLLPGAVRAIARGELRRDPAHPRRLLIGAHADRDDSRL